MKRIDLDKHSKEVQQFILGTSQEKSFAVIKCQTGKLYFYNRMNGKLANTGRIPLIEFRTMALLEKDPFDYYFVAVALTWEEAVECVTKSGS